MGAVLTYLKRHHIALLALFLALGGSAYAAKKIGSKSIKNNAVKSRHIAPGAVNASDLEKPPVTVATANPLVATDPCNSGTTGVICGNFNPGPVDGWWESAPGFAPIAFYKDASGVVHLEGVAKKFEQQGAANIIILPAGYRPAGRRVFGTLCSGSGDLSTGITEQCSILADVDGSIRWVGGSTPLGGLALDGIAFRAG